MPGHLNPGVVGVIVTCSVDGGQTVVGLSNKIMVKVRFMVRVSERG